MDRLRLATVWLGGCSGCHMSFLDLDEWLDRPGRHGRPRLSARSSTSRSTPRTSTSCLVEGAVGNEEQPGDDPHGSARAPRCVVVVRRLRRDRQRHGACATRSGARRERCCSAVYVERARRATRASRRAGHRAARCSTACMPVHEVVPVDYLPAGLPAAGRRASGPCWRSCWPAGEPQLDGPRRSSSAEADGAHAMAERIVIDPVTRIEGHAKITIYLDDAGQVADARFHVVEFRGFEKFCEGRPFCGDGRASPRASAASARSATCWPRPRPATQSWP